MISGHKDDAEVGIKFSFVPGLVFQRLGKDFCERVLLIFGGAPIFLEGGADRTCA